jgi:hypothetical protein
MARVLADKPSMNSAEIMEMTEEYGSEEVLERMNDMSPGYRELLLSC